MSVWKDLYDRYTSRKFLLAAVGVAASAYLYATGMLPADQFAKTLAAFGIPYIIIEGVADWITRAREPAP